MIANETSHTSLEFDTPPTVAAFRAHAEQQAILAGDCLTAIDQHFRREGVLKEMADFPAGFLSEVGAICQRKAWELEGLLGESLSADLLTAADAMADLSHVSKRHRRTVTIPQAESDSHTDLPRPSMAAT
jgi:hypothetical protein